MSYEPLSRVVLLSFILWRSTREVNITGVHCHFYRFLQLPVRPALHCLDAPCMGVNDPQIAPYRRQPCAPRAGLSTPLAWRALRCLLQGLPKLAVFLLIMALPVIRMLEHFVRSVTYSGTSAWHKRCRLNSCEASRLATKASKLWAGFQATFLREGFMNAIIKRCRICAVIEPTAKTYVSTSI